MSKLKEASNRARGLLHSILTSEKGNDLRPVRAARRALSLANDLAGRPLRPTEEIQRRQQEIADAAAELERARGGHAKSRREAAPVVVYTTDQDHRTPQKIADILRGREVPFQA